MEKLLEKVLFGSRWLLAPVYLGRSLILVALGVLDRIAFAAHREH